MIKPVACVIFALFGAAAVVAGPPESRAEIASSTRFIEEASLLADLSSATKSSEKRLEAIVLQLGEGPETDEARALMQTLARRETRVLVAHEESPVLIPYADVGAAARFVLRQWERDRVRESATRSLHRGNPDLVADYFAAGDAARAGIVDAVHVSSRAQLMLYRDAVAARLMEPGGDRLAAAVALTLGDDRLLTRVILEGTPAVALLLVRSLSNRLGADAALDVLKNALRRPAVASAALFEIAEMTGTMADAETVLWNTLGDPSLGGSAAAALARHADRITIDRLAAILHQSDQTLLRQRALLALRLSNEPRAAAIAADWAQAARDGAD